MRMSAVAAVALVLTGCTTGQMAATNAGTAQQASTATEREAPPPPAFRAPRQRSGVGWPDLGYTPYGR
jgi:PBP1b-binding outer membrane lipoprotein LpoB